MNTVTVANQLWEPVRVGAVLCAGRADLHRVPAYLISQSGHVLTPNVDADAWNTWHAQNVNSPAVKDGRVFAQAPIPSEAPVTTPTRKRRAGAA